MTDSKVLVTQLNRWWTNSDDSVAFDADDKRGCTWAIISGIEELLGLLMEYVKITIKTT